MTRVFVHRAAQAEIDEIYTWYEMQQQGLGNEFLSAIVAALEQIASHPLLYRTVRRDARRILLKRFPYGIYFRIRQDAIVVIACRHGRRHPDRW